MKAYNYLALVGLIFVILFSYNNNVLAKDVYINATALASCIGDDCFFSNSSLWNGELIPENGDNVYISSDLPYSPILLYNQTNFTLSSFIIEGNVTFGLIGSSSLSCLIANFTGGVFIDLQDSSSFTSNQNTAFHNGSGMLIQFDASFVQHGDYFFLSEEADLEILGIIYLYLFSFIYSNVFFWHYNIYSSAYLHGELIVAADGDLFSTGDLHIHNQQLLFFNTTTIYNAYFFNCSIVIIFYSPFSFLYYHFWHLKKSLDLMLDGQVQLVPIWWTQE